MDMMNIVFEIMTIIALVWTIFLLKDYYHLVKWLKDQAPMTWEVYNRVGKAGCQCDELCNQGRNCKNTR